jgi:hypothetical protein
MSEPFPPYAFIPGHWPHPFRDPQGHSYKLAESEPEIFHVDDWEACGSYMRGIDLFNAGYYWEAHEVWEGLWKAEDRKSSLAEFLRALIKLAAAGIKIRQGTMHSARHYLEQSRNHFRSVGAKLEQESGSQGPHHLAGLSLARLMAWCEQYIPEVEHMAVDPSLPVEVVFPEKLVLQDSSIRSDKPVDSTD